MTDDNGQYVNNKLSITLNRWYVSRGSDTQYLFVSTYEETTFIICL